jgi:hypothetical protein
MMSLNLTGHVVKMDAYCFVSGRRSDVWKGILVTEGISEVVRILHRSPKCFLVLSPTGSS